MFMFLLCTDMITARAYFCLDPSWSQSGLVWYCCSVKFCMFNRGAPSPGWVWGQLLSIRGFMSLPQSQSAGRSRILKNHTGYIRTGLCLEAVQECWAVGRDGREPQTDEIMPWSTGQAGWELRKHISIREIEPVKEISHNPGGHRKGRERTRRK